MDRTPKLILSMFIMFALMFLGLFVVAAVRDEKDNKKECIDSGGTVLEVQEGRGGYVCVPKCSSAPM